MKGSCGKMDIKHCYEILELGRNASLEQVKEAYKDLVSIWHPDRFTNNLRLKKRAEQKLKDINAAYDALRIYLTSEEHMPGRKNTRTQGEGDEQRSEGRREVEGKIDRTEAVAEAATRMALTAWVHISAAFHRFVNQISDTGKE